MILNFFLSVVGWSLVQSRVLSCHSALVCDMIISETIPDNLTFDNQAPLVVPIWRIWADLISKANTSLQLASFYWTMLNDDVSNKTYFPSSEKGKIIFNLLLEKSKIIPLEIVQNGSQSSMDLNILAKNALVKIYYIDFKGLGLNGVQHSKFWIGDKKSAFIGSANMDWRSISEVKELGVYIPNCHEIVQDVEKFWEVLQILSGPNASIPDHWPSRLSPAYNHTNPLIATINGNPSKIYTATSPPMFNPPYRTDDLTAIIQTIKQAKSYICISVMDYLPLDISYSRNGDKFWPNIDDELKRAAIDRHVSVKLLISLWKHSRKDMISYARSLNYLSKIKNIDIEVKAFIVPAFREYQRILPYSRVSHSKYMVTDNTVYIGTSNWSGDYFKRTGGFSLVAEEINPDHNNAASIRWKLYDIFKTDWNSIYAHALN